MNLHTRRLRLLALALPTLISLAAAPALAGVPSPWNSTVPTHVSLVGWTPAGADSATGHVVVIYRDIANNPTPDMVIRFDFSACADLRLDADPHDPRLTVDCARRSVSAITGPDGSASFTFVGGGYYGPAHGPQIASVYARWINYPGQEELLRDNVRVSAYDLNGSTGVALNDVSLWAADFFGSTNPSRSDYDGNGFVELMDLGAWLTTWLGNCSQSSAADYCP